MLTAGQDKPQFLAPLPGSDGNDQRRERRGLANRATPHRTTRHVRPGDLTRPGVRAVCEDDQ